MACESKTTAGIIAGLAGALAVTVIHETARHVVPHAPRVDVLGKRAIRRSAKAVGLQPPAEPSLYVLALAADLLSNGAIYAFVAAGARRTLHLRGLLLGLLAGGMAVFLPRPLHLGRQPNQKTPVTQGLTMLWYTIGGVVAAMVYEQMDVAE